MPAKRSFNISWNANPNTTDTTPREAKMVLVFIPQKLRIAIPANMVLEIGGEAISGSKPIFGIGTHIAYKLKLYSQEEKICSNNQQ